MQRWERFLQIFLVPLMATSISATTSASPAAPEPICNVPPRSYLDLTTLVARTDLTTPSATTGGQTLPPGMLAGASDANAIENTVRQWLACENAGEPLRAWSLFSDGYLYRLLSRENMTSEGNYQALATPSPSSSNPATLQSIEGERVLADGRLGAVVTIAYPSVPMPKRFFFSFTRSDDHLLIDGILGEISFSVP
jgi:hypothetical protein